MPITVAKDPSVSPKKKVEPLPLGEITSDELANTFKVVLERFKLRKPQVGQIEVHEASIEEMTTFLKDKLHHRKSTSFFDCIKNFQDLDQVIGLFLAVLELCRDHKILVKQNRDFGDLELEKVETNGK